MFILQAVDYQPNSLQYYRIGIRLNGDPQGFLHFRPFDCYFFPQRFPRKLDEGQFSSTQFSYTENKL